jgi:2-hydroxychromene-2-carboxylate isomerase
MAIDIDSAHFSGHVSVTADKVEKCVDFYFDFISPFGFFASLQIGALAARYGYSVRWHSMLIGVSVLKVMGMKPFLKIPLKGPHTIRDAQRYARKQAITFGRKIDDPLVDPRPAGKAFNWMQKQRLGTAKHLRKGFLMLIGWRDKTSRNRRYCLMYFPSNAQSL